MPKIIAFGHQKRVGKDTAGRFLMTHIRTTRRNSHIVKGGFADKLKDVCYQLYKWAGLQPAEYYEEHPEMREVILPLIGMTPREIWIKFGNGVRSTVYDDTWLDYFIHSVKADIIINTDCRFANEANKILAAGGAVIKIMRPSVPHTSDAADDPLLFYDKWTDVIVNDGDLDCFYHQVIAIAEKYL